MALKTALAFLLVGFVTTIAPLRQALADQTASLNGNWSGTTKVRCGSQLSAQERCNAYQHISFRLIQEGSKISGTYSCAFGTQPCLGLNESGNITGGSYDGKNLLLNIDMGNGSTCRFTGSLADDKGQGSYRCKGNGAAEQGTWRLHRGAKSTIPKEPLIPPILRP
jgi:hypothetical protein